MVQLYKEPVPYVVIQQQQYSWQLELFQALGCVLLAVYSY